ncbi:RNA polymerase sigma factor [Planctomycetota bacterium]
MPSSDFDTTMGGENRPFQPTCWTEIREALTLNPERQQRAVNKLFTRYWKPVYCYLRHKGNTNDQAKDLTQGFFYEIVLGRGLLGKADQAKGKFRTFLLTSLDHYIVSEHRKQGTQKRRPKNGLFQMETTSLENLPKSESEKTPDAVFCYAWATDILDQVLNILEHEYRSTHRDTYWELFQQRILLPILEGYPKPSLSELCEKLGIETKKKASNMIITVKRRFVAILRTLIDDDDFHDFIKILSG